MYLRRVFTLDPERFPLDLVRQLVDYLHSHQQHYIVMVDPAVGAHCIQYDIHQEQLLIALQHVQPTKPKVTSHTQTAWRQTHS